MMEPMKAAEEARRYGYNINDDLFSVFASRLFDSKRKRLNLFLESMDLKNIICMNF